MIELEDAAGERGERDLWRRLGRGDEGAREELVDFYLPLARRMAKRYAGVLEPYDDLLQVACLGLLQAIDRYDPGTGTPFLAFARPTILGELKRHLRDKVWPVRVPRALHDRLPGIDSVVDELTAEWGRAPSVGEIAARLGVERTDVLEALEADRNRRTVSLDAPPPEADADDGSRLEALPVVDHGFDLVEDRIAMAAALPQLDGRAIEVLRLRFVDELSQRKIATRLGVSQMYVSRLLRRSLETLREAAAA